MSYILLSEPTTLISILEPIPSRAIISRFVKRGCSVSLFRNFERFIDFKVRKRANISLGFTVGFG